MIVAKFFLNSCSSIFYLVVGIYSLFLLCAVCRRVFHGMPIPWHELRLPGGPAVWVLISVVSIVGLINITLESSLESTEIGSFYEMSEYEEDYEATLFIDEKPIFCIASVGKFDSVYTVYRLSLPYGSSVEVDEVYDPKEGYLSLQLGEWEWDCELEIGTPATPTSFELLSHITISRSGEFCGSRTSGTYHFPDCPYVKNISPENFIHFETEAEADVLGFLFCNSCLNRY